MKTNKTKKQLKRELLITRIGFYFFFTIILFLGGRIFYTQGVFNGLMPLDDVVDVIFFNLSEQEKKEIEQYTVNNTHPDFLMQINSVEFSGDLNFCEERIGNKYNTGCEGYSVNRDIFVEYRTKAQTRRIFCHEILHSVIPVDNGLDYSDSKHRIIDYLSRLGVCYK